MAVIEVHGLSKSYGDRQVLDDVSFEVGVGEIFGVLGPNGAGKTTAVECVEGLRRPDGGTVRVLGLDPHGDGKRLRQRIGVQLQQANLPDLLRVREALELYASFYDRPAPVQRLLADWGLADLAKTKFGALSGGQRQRLFIALALVGNPDVVFLDELTTGLDPHARRETWKHVKRIRDAGVTVLLVSHFMDEVEELCDRLLILDAGAVVAVDTPGGLIAGADAESRLSFRPLAEIDLVRFADLPGVTDLQRSGQRVVVTGRGGFADEVTGLLAREHVLVADLRIEERSLDDAYLALTGHAYEGV